MTDNGSQHSEVLKMCWLAHVIDDFNSTPPLGERDEHEQIEFQIKLYAGLERRTAHKRSSLSTSLHNSKEGTAQSKWLVGSSRRSHYAGPM